MIVKGDGTPLDTIALGLNILYEELEDIESEQGKGTTFTISLPIKHLFNELFDLS